MWPTELTGNPSHFQKEPFPAERYRIIRIARNGRTVRSAHSPFCPSCLALALVCPPEESHNLGTGAVGIGRECRRTGAAGDPLRNRPVYGLCIISIGTHICKRSRRGNCCPLQRKVTIWARLQVTFGLKVVALVPLVIPFSTAHRTAL